MQVILLNTKTLDKQIEELNNSAGTRTIIFIETTNKKVTSSLFDKEKEYPSVYSIDPQHTGITMVGGSHGAINISACLWSYLYRSVVKEMLPSSPELIYVLEKPDIDSIATLAVCEAIRKDELKLSWLERLEQIDAIDSWKQPREWDPNYHKKELIITVEWTHYLGRAMSDFEAATTDKLVTMVAFLEDGTLPLQYKEILELELSRQKEAVTTTISDIYCVTCQARGASSILYSGAPYGIAFNPQMNISGVEAAKFSIMQFAPEYLDLPGFWSYMNENHPEEVGTWGGGATAGGSPHGTQLPMKVVAKALAKFVIKPYIKQV